MNSLWISTYAKLKIFSNMYIDTKWIQHHFQDTWKLLYVRRIIFTCLAVTLVAQHTTVTKMSCNPYNHGTSLKFLVLCQVNTTRLFGCHMKAWPFYSLCSLHVLLPLLLLSQLWPKHYRLKDSGAVFLSTVFA